MAGPRTLIDAQERIEELAIRAAIGHAEAYREDFIGPIERLVDRLDGSGDDEADARALLDAIPGLFDAMDEQRTIETLAAGLVQAGSIGQTTAAPAVLPEPDPDDVVPEDDGGGL